MTAPACDGPSKVPTAHSSSRISGNTSRREKELIQAHNLAAAAAQAGVRHAIWSTLEDTRDFFPADGARMPVLAGPVQRPALRRQGCGHRFFAQQRVPVTFLYTSGYWENLIQFGMGPQRGADGALCGDHPHRRCAHSVDRRRGHRHRGARDLPARRRADRRVDRHRRRSPDGRRNWPRSSARRSASPCTTTRCRPSSSARFAFPGRRRARQHVAVQARFRSARTARAAICRARARCIPAMAIFATWLAANKSRIPVAKAA